MIFREVAAAAVAMVIRGRFYRQQLGSRPNNFPAKLPTLLPSKRNLAIESGTYICTAPPTTSSHLLLLLLRFRFILRCSELRLSNLSHLVSSRFVSLCAAFPSEPHRRLVLALDVFWSALWPGAEGVFEEGLPECQFAWVADEVEAHLVHDVAVSDSGVWVGEANEPPAPGVPP